MSEITGLTVTHPQLGWTFVIATLAIAGLPPMGVFMSEFLVVSSTMTTQPLLALPLILGLLVAFGALVLRATAIAFGEPPAHSPFRIELSPAAYVPIYAHLALIVLAGLYLPAPLVEWLGRAAGFLG